jgi:hypothetical protein
MMNALQKASHRRAPQPGGRAALFEVAMSIPSKDLATTPGPTAPAKSPNQHLRRNPPIAGEAEAIARAQAGDGASFEILYGLHKRRV